MIFYYNINRKVPFIIWSKDGGYEPKEITQVMGMYDVQPTLGNMLGFENKYALGHDIFSIGDDEENIVIFPNGNFLTDTIYYNSQKEKYFDITGYENVAKYASCNQVYKDTPNPIYSEEDENYISELSSYSEERINISNAIIYYDMINKTDQGFGDGMNSTDVGKDKFSIFSPPSADERDRLFAA